MRPYANAKQAALATDIRHFTFTSMSIPRLSLFYFSPAGCAIFRCGLYSTNTSYERARSPADSRPAAGVDPGGPH
jgi:hypothetical protein